MADIDVWILRDDDPYGGFYAAQARPFDPREERKSIAEVRVVSMPEETWDFLLSQGGAPVDTMPDGSTSNDSTWLPWYQAGHTIWSR